MIIRGVLNLFLVCAFFLSGCDRATKTPVPPAPNVSVTATVYPLAQIAQEVGLDRVTTEWVLEKPADIVGYVPADREREIIRGSSLLLVGGPIDAWALEGRDAQRERDIVRLNVAFPLDGVSGSALWLNPEAAYGLADVLFDRLQTRLPEDRERLSKAREDFKAKVRALQKEFMTPLAEVQGTKVATLSPVFDALLVRYNLPAIRLAHTPPQQLSDQQLVDLKNAAVSQGIHWLILDASLPDGLVNVIESRTGLKVIRLEVLGSSAPSSPVHTYIEICRYNLTQLARLK